MHAAKTQKKYDQGLTVYRFRISLIERVLVLIGFMPT